MKRREYTCTCKSNLRETTCLHCPTNSIYSFESFLVPHGHRTASCARGIRSQEDPIGGEDRGRGKAHKNLEGGWEGGLYRSRDIW